MVPKLEVPRAEGKPISAIGRGLIMATRNRQPPEIAIQQSPRAAVSDDGDIAALWSQRYDFLDGADDPRLGMDCWLPAPNADFWPGKECADSVCEFFRRKITGRGSIILLEAVDHAVSVKSEPFGENTGPLFRFALVAGEDAPHTSCPGTGRHQSHARPAPLIERPLRDRYIRINPDIRMRDEKDGPQQQFSSGLRSGGCWR
jgi:hypothetical protein